MPWFSGATLSDVLHDFSKENSQENEFRMDVQQVYHVQNDEFVDYRAYAGRITSVTLKVGDTVAILPLLKQIEVIEISKFKSNLEKGKKGDSIQIRLKDNIDISRGMMLVKQFNDFLFQKELKATIVWIDETLANLSSKYIIQVGSRTSFYKIKSIDYLINPINPSDKIIGTTLKLNDIGVATIHLANPIFVDTYTQNKDNGAFIIIDSITNNTVGVGFVA
jgi:sulfate adenylyltransferase subunit 1